MHSVGQQQQQRRGGNPTRMPMMYSNNLPPGPLLPGPPPPVLRYGGPANYQQLSGGPGSGGGGGGGMKHHSRSGGNRNGRGGGMTITHRQQRPTASSRYHPYPFRQPLPPQQRFYRPAQTAPQRTPAALMGTPPGMSQSEYEPIHFAQVQRDKEKLVRHGHVLAPSNTTQFLIRDHNRQTTPSAIATPTPTHQSNADSSSPSNTQNPSASSTALSYDQMFDMADVDAQSDETESNQDLGLAGLDSSFDNDFNDIYYQCRYERYAAFSRTNLLNEVLSLCANIDRLQHEKSEVEKRLRDVQQHLYELTATSTTTSTASGSNTPAATPPATTNGTANRSTNDEDSQVRSPLADHEENESHDHGEVNRLDDDLSATSSSQSIPIEQQEISAPIVSESSIETSEHEQQIATD